MKDFPLEGFEFEYGVFSIYIDSLELFLHSREGEVMSSDLSPEDTLDAEKHHRGWTIRDVCILGRAAAGQRPSWYPEVIWQSSKCSSLALLGSSC